MTSFLSPGIYLTVIMAMSALSVALSVFVLNCHHRGTMMQRPSRIIRELCIFVGRICCVRLLYLKKKKDSNSLTSPPAPSINGTTVKSPLKKKAEYHHFSQAAGGVNPNPNFGASDSSPMLSNHSENSRQHHHHHNQMSPVSNPLMTHTANSSPQSFNGNRSIGESTTRQSQVTDNTSVGVNIAALTCNGAATTTTISGTPALAQTPPLRTRAAKDANSKTTNRTVLESQILQYLKAVLEAYDNSFEDRVAILEWQEVARVLDKFFFWLFVAITTLSTIFLLLLSPITKKVDFPEE